LEFVNFVDFESFNTKEFFKSCEGFIVVYDVSKRKSLEFASKMIQEIYKKKELEVNSFPIILVGNKSDLENLREISHQEGRKVADTFNDVGFFEVSAKLGSNIQESVFYLVEKILIFKQIVGLGTPIPKQKKCEMM
jgi:GTPase KRas